MKKLLAMAVAASALAVAAPASAQSWQSINARQERLDDRIDMGVRNGSLTRREAANLRMEFQGLARLEARYRSTYGLSVAERRDLDRRFDSLSSRIRYERNDRDDRGWRGDDDRGWQSINQRQRQLDTRIDRGVRDGSLSRREAYRLRAEFNDLARLEARYRATNGLNRNERIDLDRRFDRLSARVMVERRDGDGRRG
jgi:hypothetical protein